MRRALTFVSLLCLSVAAGWAQSPQTPSRDAMVRIDNGVLEGAMPQPGMRAFLGIPYAQPPVGALRWQAPEPYGQWTGVRTAVKAGAPCAQQKYGWNDALAARGSEDCLYLNVWAPEGGSRHPVMVYIHGGSNLAGAAADGITSGLGFVPHGVVLVSMDYRLGVFGFFRTPSLDQESPEHASGDYGLLDQVAALRWVQQNIASFGGDPHNVTIFGQSAGAVDVGLLMTSPLASGLFQKAMEESGQVLGLMPTATQIQSEAAWKPVAEKLGPTLHAMRADSTSAVLAADNAVPTPPPQDGWGHRGASIDGWVLPHMPYEVYAHGAEAPVPLLIGSNVQEILWGNQTNAQALAEMTRVLGPVDAKRLMAIYTAPSANPLLGTPAARWATDHDFRCAVRQVADWHSALGLPTYVYQFDHPLPGNRTALHTSELFFLFGTIPGEKELTPEQKTLSSTLDGYWTSFGAKGDPNHPGAPIWPKYTGAVRAYLHFPVGDAPPNVEVNLGGQACTIISPRLAGGQ